MALKNPVIFISALPQEIKSLRYEFVSEVRYKQPPVLAWSGHINDQDIVLMCSGVGLKASIMASDIITKSFNPRLVINVGYAGGAHPDLACGDLIIPEKIFCETGESIVVENSLREIAKTAANAAVVKYKELNTVTVSNVIDKPEEKAMWGTRFNAWAIDMETFHIAKMCKKQRIPFLAVRIILDPLSFKLPNKKMVENDGSLKWFNIAKIAIKSPSILLRLAGKQSLADEHLSNFLTTLLPLVSTIDPTKSEKEIKEKLHAAEQTLK